MKIYQVFDSYPLFYQPYIPPVIDALQNQKGMDINIVAFNGVKGERDKAEVLPQYKKRKVLSKILQFQNKEYRNLDYFEIKALKEKVDIIHIQHSYLYSKVHNLLSIPKHKRPKIVITLRGGDTYIKPWVFDNWSDFYKNYGNKVDAFVVMSEHQKKYLHSKWGVETERIHVIPISFGNNEHVNSKYPNTDKMRIISAFRMCWEKNIEGNLRTIKLLKEQGIPVQYDVYGDGQDAGQLYYLIDKYNLTDCVLYNGKIENKELKSILPKYDFFLQLSHSESLGLSVVEAQSFGVPVIVSNSDGLPESILDGKTGFIVNPYDVAAAANSMLKLWKDRERYNSFSKEAIRFVNSKFTILNEVEKLKKLYLDLTKR
ncbi:glycosyltransferase family 4 protein [Aequorivita marina]|uniref:glycosyltransferase family 4 protein n=1 Tax=Aequorivita marina TaxID=3073654 RepID=UPI00287402CF|nr:glycosyltransferase family 4 protein [Aequorivita sp. S2608]MDS1298052.1 glycosyltransferase family 4 protein [Aequorivita sp. S2608]